MVIGAPDRDELDDAAQRAAGRLAREVNVNDAAAKLLEGGILSPW